MKTFKRFTAIILVLVLVLSSVSLVSAANTSPYYIMVNRQMNTVTIYTKDAAGNYTVPYKAMVCSTGRAGHETPKGTFTTKDSKSPWHLMVDGSYGQYSTRFNGQILFHSVCYSAADSSKLITEEYNMLGGPASLGCVRLQVRDAKWIYDNVPAGTTVVVYDSPYEGPLGKPDKAVMKITEGMPAGWDPTDPNPANPWNSILLPFDDLCYGSWSYEYVREVYNKHYMNGGISRDFMPKNTLTREEAIQIVYNIMGRPAVNPDSSIRISDLSEGDWSYPAVAWYLCANYEFDDVITFRPKDPATREFFVQVLYDIQENSSDDLFDYTGLDYEFTDDEAIAVAAKPAVYYFYENGIVTGYPDGSFMPQGKLTREEAATLLARLY